VTVAQVEITPESFQNVFFEHAQIEAVASKLIDDLGITAAVRIDVDESTPLSKVRQTSVDPLVLAVESGALEDNKRPRQFGEVQAADALGRALAKAADRLDPSFGAPDLDEQLPLPHLAAWDTYCVGRLVRMGYAPQRQRRLYTFELRHGFTDVALAAFEQLWNAESLTWPEIVAISDEARAVIDAA
jgi:hypothetical protein